MLAFFLFWPALLGLVDFISWFVTGHATLVDWNWIHVVLAIAWIVITLAIATTLEYHKK
jgi:uncharacterized membrane protein